MKIKKNKTLIFTKILSSLFIIETIISLFIVYRDIEGTFVFRFLSSYVVLTFFMLIYFPIITIINARKFKWIEIRSKLFKFIIIFTLTAVMKYLFGYLFTPAKIDLFNIIFTSLGLSFGISFIDIIFLKNKEDDINLR